ncbi:hypothetical protein [Pelobacter seleniigenes]|uniref:hypothetical protein n=1 Tax=Pelobacter seleniigenes TaxID=407188 RepID=UPI0004A70720|nr:hypothetical protein [Pelobacter seleniigenes]
MEINFNKGVDNIVFGMTEEEVINALGKPNKTVITDEENRDLYFYAIKLVLKIERENDWRLGWIEVRNKNATLMGNNPWLQSRECLLEQLSHALGEAFEFTDYGSFESYCFNENWVELQYELGELRTINFGVLYGDDDEPMWPPR